MFDLWSFLHQTAAASMTALFVLVLQHIFRDKLSPQWQYAVWMVVVLRLILPVGWLGRSAIADLTGLGEALRTWVELGLDSAWSSPWTPSLPLAGIPIPPAGGLPRSVTDWLFLLYLAGVLLSALWLAAGGLRLRRSLGEAVPVAGARLEAGAALAERFGLSMPRRVVESRAASTPFLVGVVRPVLVLPMGWAPDRKVILHELIHLKQRDVAAGWVTALFRCVHWCNPFLWRIFDRIDNQREQRCDQLVLERLEGEDRRDYGRILLSAASEQYARAPGTSSLSNGGRNIRARIQAIARFKRYPAGMALVSVCIAVVLGLPLVLGRAQALAPAAGLDHDDQAGFCLAMASARLTPCTTLAGALDAYGKAVLGANGIYRALCAPLADHPALAAEMETAASGPDHWVHEHWESGLPGDPDASAGYFLYNLEETEGYWEGLMVWPLRTAYLNGPEEPPVYETDDGCLYAACQQVRTERQGGRWVVLPQGDFWVEVTQTPSSSASGLSWGDAGLPAAVYRGEAGDFALEVAHQTIWAIDNTVETGTSWFFGPSTSFDTVPKPHARFDGVNDTDLATLFFTGPAERRGEVAHVSVSLAPLDQEGAEAELPQGSRWTDSSSHSSTGAFQSSKTIPADWGGTLWLGGGGGGGMNPEEVSLPAAYAGRLTVNGGNPVSLTLYPVEGGGEG